MSSDGNSTDSPVVDEKKVPFTVSREGEVDLIDKIEHAAKLLHMELTIAELNFFVDKIGVHSLEECVGILKEAYEYHKDDMNLEFEDVERLKKLSEGRQASPELSDEDYEFEMRFEATLISEWSPYRQVRAATSMVDDPYEPAETIRMYLVGLIYANVGSLVAVFFTMRWPQITISFLALQTLIYPTGKFLELILPDWGFKMFGKRHSLNPGPWTFKEQMLATLMMSSVDGPPNAVQQIIVQHLPNFYGYSFAGKFGYMLLLVLTSQFMGYGVAGLLRSLLIYPVKTVWFEVLPFLTMNRALVKREQKEVIHAWGFRWTVGRYVFFFVVVFYSFCWYWFPDFLFSALSYFNWMTWISPQNVALAAVTGSVTGLGFNPIQTFDWSVIFAVNSGMALPWFASWNTLLGQIIGFFIVVGLWFSKSSYTQYLPINSANPFDNTGQPYNATRVINSNGTFNSQGYYDYSPAYISAGLLVTQGAGYAMLTASVVYALLYFRTTIKEALKNSWISLRGHDRARALYTDPFTRAMQIHHEVPQWWYISTLVMSIVLYIVMVEVYPETQTPVWTVFFAIAVNIIFILALGPIFAYTSVFLDVGPLIQVLIAYMLPHHANAMMITIATANNFWEQAQNFITNQKQTHYARIASRSLFRAQFLGTFVTVFTNVALLSWTFTGIPNLCSPTQSQKYFCSYQDGFFSTNLLWGSLGPQILFALYPVMKYTFLIGVFIPIPFFFLEKWKPKIFRRFHPVLITAGVGTFAPYSIYYYIGQYYTGFIFNWWVFRKWPAWWSKYNYVLYAALTTGYGFAAIIVFFATGYNHIASVSWWGNNVPFAGMDGIGPPLVTLVNQTFGPAPSDLPF